ncbi:MAG: HYExAFE family protein, partial [Planctomycetes bacterium]|nr:HYExAFE family protein [Planctomycetota bacterium]
DFIVHAHGERLLIDVKGRKYPGGKNDKPTYVWQNWSTQDDIDGLDRWERQFGSGSLGLLVFIYHLAPTVELPPGTVDLWHWRGRRYLMRAISVADYKQSMRIRSRKWGTVYLPGPAFRSTIRPFRDFSHPALVV